MRTINEIILHCSATTEGRDVSTEEIRRWHVRSNGWSDIGYHFVIELDGEVKVGRPVARVGAHVKGRNRKSIGVCYVGGIGKESKRPEDTMTPDQEAAFHNLVAVLRGVFGDIPVNGHNQYANKACPSFVVTDKWPHING